MNPLEKVVMHSTLRGSWLRLAEDLQAQQRILVKHAMTREIERERERERERETQRRSDQNP